MCPVGRSSEGAIWSNPSGAGRNGAIAALPERGDTARYHPARAPCASPVAARRNASYLRDRTLGWLFHLAQIAPARLGAVAHDEAQRQHDRQQRQRGAPGEAGDQAEYAEALGDEAARLRARGDPAGGAAAHLERIALRRVR